MAVRTRSSVVVAGLLAIACLPSSVCAQTPPAATQAASPADFSPDVVKSALAQNLPGMWNLVEFTQQAMINAGTPIEPEMQTRFAATLALAADTFAIDERSGPITFVRRVAQKGVQKTLYGTSRSTLNAGHWDTKLALQNADVLTNIGQPLATIAGEVIVRGTDEEAAYFKQREQEAAQAQQAALAEAARREQLAAEQRKANAAEAEAKRQAEQADALAQTRREAAVAAARAEAAAAETLAQTRRDAALAAAKTDADNAKAAAAAAHRREQEQLDAEAGAKLQQTRAAAEQATLQQQRGLLASRQAVDQAAQQQQRDQAASRQAAEQARRRDLDALRASLQSQSTSERLAALEGAIDSEDATIRTLAIQTALGGKDTAAQNIVLRHVLQQRKTVLFKVFAPSAWANGEVAPQDVMTALGGLRMDVKTFDLKTGTFTGVLQLGRDLSWTAAGSVDRGAVTIVARAEGKPLPIYSNPTSLAFALEISSDKELDGVARLEGGNRMSPLIVRIDLD